MATSHPICVKTRANSSASLPTCKSYFSQVEGMFAGWKFVYSGLFPKVSPSGEGAEAHSAGSSLKQLIQLLYCVLCAASSFLFASPIQSMLYFQLLVEESRVFDWRSSLGWRNGKILSCKGLQFKCSPG